MISKFTPSIVAAVLGLAVSFASVGARATNLVTNGGFETTTSGGGS